MTDRSKSVPVVLARLKAVMLSVSVKRPRFRTRKKSEAGNESTTSPQRHAPVAHAPVPLEQTSREHQNETVRGISTKGKAQNPVPAATEAHVATVHEDSTENRRTLSREYSHLLEPGARLWDEAYTSLKVIEPELLSVYEGIIHKYQTSNSQESPTASLPHAVKAVDNVLEDKSKPLWVKQMTILETWMAERDDPLTCRGGPLLVRQLITVFKDIVRPSAISMKQAAWPWVAACFAAETLFHCYTLSGPVALGFIELVSKLNFFGRLSRFSPYEADAGEMIHTLETTKIGHNCTRDALVSIYASVLLYFVRIACSRSDGSMIIEPGVLDQLSGRIRQMEGTFIASFDTKIGEKLRALFSQAEHRGKRPTSYAGKENADRGMPSNLALPFEESAEILRKACHTEEPPEDLLDWICSTKEYTEFRRKGTDASRVLCVTGSPGAGKSMVLLRIAQYMMGLQDRSSGCEKVACFFGNRSGLVSENPAAIVHSLIRQLIKHKSSLLHHLDKAYEATRRQSLDRTTDDFMVFGVLLGILEDPEVPETCFIVDAIDQCGVDEDDVDAEQWLDNFLGLVSATIKRSPKIRWVISMCPAIEKRVSLCKSIVLELDSKSIATILEQSVGSKVATIAENIHLSSDTNALLQLQEYLTKRSQGNPLWVRVACKLIKHHPFLWDIMAVLQELPNDLEGLYNYSMTTISKLRPKSFDFCRQILQITAAAYRPLYLWELQAIAELPAFVDVKFIVAKGCFAFLDLYDDRVMFVHSSAKNYLRKTLLQESKARGEFVLRCLQFLPDHCRAAVPVKSQTEQKGDIPVLSHYAEWYWMRHLSALISRDANDVPWGQLATFLDQSLLIWIDRLVLAQGLAVALTQMTDLVLVLRKYLDRGAGTQNPRAKFCLSLLQRATLFLRFHQSTDSPEGVPASNSLIFYPTQPYSIEKMLSGKVPWLAPSPVGRVTPVCLALNGHHDWVRGSAYSGDGRLVATCSDDRTVRIWDAHTGELRVLLDKFDKWVKRVTFSPSGLLATSEASVIKIWDYRLSVLEKTFKKHDLLPGEKSEISHLKFSPKGDQLAAAINKTVFIWDTRTYEAKKWERQAFIRQLTFSADGRLLAIASSSDIAILLVEDGRSIWSRPLENDREEINGICFSPDSKSLASCSTDCTVQVWDITSDAPAHTIRCGTVSSYASIDFSAHGLRFAAAAKVNGTNSIEVWNIQGTGYDTPQHITTCVSDTVLSLSYSPTEQYLASSSMDGVVRIWDLENASLPILDVPERAGDVIPHVKHKERVCFVTISVSGKLIASASSDGQIHIWNGCTGRHKKPLDVGGEHNFIIWLAFSADESMLVATSEEGGILVWDLEASTQPRWCHAHEDWVRSAVFSPDSKLLASVSDDMDVKVWKLLSDSQSSLEGQQPTILKAHTSFVICAAFSADGKFIASGGDDCVRIWDLTLVTHQEGESITDLSRFEGHDERVTAVAFSPDGEVLVSSSWDEVNNPLNFALFFLANHGGITAVAILAILELVKDG